MKEEMKKENRKKHLEENDNSEVLPPLLWDVL